MSEDATKVGKHLLDEQFSCLATLHLQYIVSSFERIALYSVHAINLSHLVVIGEDIANGSVGDVAKLTFEKQMLAESLGGEGNNIVGLVGDFKFESSLHSSRQVG